MTEKKLLDDLAHLAHGAMNVADSLKADIRLFVQQTCEAWLKDAQPNPKNDLHAIRQTLKTLQKQQDVILQRLDALEKKQDKKTPSQR
ncbi:MAG: hypothetical protein GDA50_02560 [Alphaproteobacteria bacterium GM202ARS2]|nr:hypothetical protein [Alphaproteobacteria bacterium GM202ARS2]